MNRYLPRIVPAVAALLAALMLVAAALALLDSPDAIFGGAPPVPTSRASSTPAGAVELQPGDTADQIAQRLHAAGVIDSPRRWTTIVQLLGWEEHLEVGSYTFEAGLTSYEIARRIHTGERTPLRVTFPEGLRLEQIGELLEAEGVVAAADFAAALTHPENSAGTLAASRPPGVGLEGYLFAATYDFPLGVSADQVVRLMLERFDAVVTSQLLDAVANSGRTLHEVLTVASIVEREAAVNEERPIIAAVLWNRIELGMPLQVDPTVQYAVAGNPAQVALHGWWKAELTREDLASTSPWNTYTAAGLPPTPIAAPGEASLRAALAPADVSFLFFVARGDGTHAFAETLAGHEANVERWRPR